MPILSNVKIEAEGDGIRLFATDLEIGLQDTIPAELQSPGRITLSAKKFYEIARELTEHTVVIESREGQGVSIQSGKSNFILRGISADEFPSFPEIKEIGKITLQADVLREMIRKTAYAASSDLTRIALNGVLLHLVREDTGQIRMVATDGHRLSLISREVSEDGERTKDLKLIIPKKAISELKKYLDEGEHQEMEILLSEKHILFREGKYLLLSRIIDGKFPRYEEVIPQENPHQLTLDREMFQGVVRRVAILSDEKTHAVKLMIQKGEIVISSSNPEMGEAHESLVADYRDQELETGFNVRYLQDVCGALNGKEIRFRFQEPLSPTRIEDPEDSGFVGVIMPMRL